MNFSPAGRPVTFTATRLPPRAASVAGRIAAPFAHSAGRAPEISAQSSSTGMNAAWAAMSEVPATREREGA